MTNISGSVLRAVADWYGTQDGTDVLVSRLRDDAKKVDVDEERVNRLAEVFREAGAIEGALGFDVGRGIRAVLAEIDGHVDVEIVDDEPRQWERIEDVPIVVEVVDKVDRRWRHFSESGWKVWRGPLGSYVHVTNLNEFTPFTEVVDGVR